MMMAWYSITFFVGFVSGCTVCNYLKKPLDNMRPKTKTKETPEILKREIPVDKLNKENQMRPKALNKK